jgi:uncharacterized integral membrane protein
MITAGSRRNDLRRTAARRTLTAVSTPDPHPADQPRDPLSVGPPSSTSPRTGSQPTTPAPAPAAPKRRTGRTISRTLALALLVFVTVILVLFVVFNTQTVDISLVFADVEAPLVLALLVAAGLGALVISLLGAVMRARRRKSN